MTLFFITSLILLWHFTFRYEQWKFNTVGSVWVVFMISWLDLIMTLQNQMTCKLQWGVGRYISLLTAKDIWIKFDLSLRFIPPINLWKICIDFRPTSKMTSWPQRPRKRLSGFFQNIHFWNQWIKLRKMSYGLAF